MLACALILFPLCVCRVAVVQAISFQRKTLSYMLLVNPSNLFSINQESGALSLTRTVDFESGQHLHHLQVRASEPDTGLSNMAEVSTRLPSYLNRFFTWFSTIFISKCTVSTEVHTKYNRLVVLLVLVSQLYIVFSHILNEINRLRPDIKMLYVWLSIIFHIMTHLVLSEVKDAYALIHTITLTHICMKAYASTNRNKHISAEKH